MVACDGPGPVVACEFGVGGGALMLSRGELVEAVVKCEKSGERNVSQLAK